MSPTKIPLRLLIVEDSEDDAFLLVRTLTQKGFDVDFKCIETSSEMRQALEEQPWDAVISDYQMPSFDGLAALGIYKEFDLDIPFVVVSGAIGEETAVKVMKAGAHDYLLKHNLARLVPVIERELQEARLRQERREALRELQHSESRYRAIVEDQTEMINRSTLDGTITFVNNAYARLYDRTPEYLIGKEYSDFIAESRVDHLAKVRSLLTTEHPVSTNESRYEKKDGSIIWVQWRDRLLFDSTGNPVEYQGVGRDITEQKQAEEELKRFAANLERRAVQIQVAAETARDATSIRELDDLLHRAVNLAGDRFGFYHVAVFLIDESGEYAALKAASGEAGRKMIAMGHKLKVGEVGIVGNVAAVGEPHIALDVDADSVHHVQPLLPKTRSEIALPLKVGESIIGVLDVQSEKEIAFDDDDVQIIQTMADQLAIAIDNLRLLEEVQQHANELESLYNAALVTSSELEIDALLIRLYEQVQRFISLDSFMVALYEEERQNIHIALAIEAGEPVKAFQGIRVPFEEGGISSHVIKTRKSLLVKDLVSDRLPIQPVSDPNEVQPTRAWLGVPLIARDKILGVISVQSYQAGAFDEGHQRFLESLASQVAITFENARLFEAERSAREQAETLREIARVISGSIELDRVLNLILEQIKHVLVFDTASVLLFDEKKKTALVAGLGYDDEESTSQSASMLLKDSPILQAMSENLQPIIIPDVTQNPEWIWVPGAEHVRSFLGVPIITRQKMIGAFMVDQVLENAFTEEDALTVQAIAQHMAIAIETVRLFEAERFQLLQARTLQEVGMLLTSELGLDEVLERILDLLGRVVQYDSVSVQLIETGPQLYLAAGRGFDNLEKFGRVVRELSSHNLARFEKSEGKAIVIPDTTKDEIWLSPSEVEYIKSWIGAPLLARGKLIGLLTVDSCTPETYSDDIATTVVALANQAAIAIENVQLFEAERSAREQAEALREAAQVISSTLSLDQVIEVVLEQLARVLTYDSGSVILVEGDRAYVQAGYGYDHAPASEYLSDIEFDMSAETIRYVVQEGQPLMIPDIQQDERWLHTAVTGNVHSWLGIPLKVRDQVVGIINLERNMPQGFSDDEISLAQVFATHTSTAIENAHLFEKEEKRAEELETIRKVGLSLTASLEPEAVLDAVLKGVYKLMPRIWHANIFIYEKNKLTFGAEFWVDEKSKLTLLSPCENSPIARVALNGEMVSIPEFPLNQLFEDLDNEEFEGAFISLPLKTGERVTGVMSVVYVDSQIVSPARLRVLNLLVDQAALTIENARLFETAEKRAAELEKLRQVSLGLTASLELKAVQNTILEGIYKLMPNVWDAHIFIYDNQELTFGAALWQNGTSGKSFAEPRFDGLTYTAARTGEMVVVSDMATHPLFDGVASEKGWIGGIIGLPLKIGERVIGVMTIAYQEPITFTQDELRVLRLLGDQSALAIENAHLFEQTITERRHISLLYDVGWAVASSLDVTKILERAIGLTCKALNDGVGTAWAFTPEDNCLHIRTLYNQGLIPLAELETDDVLPVPLETGLIGWVAKHRQPVNVDNVTEDPRWVEVSYFKETVYALIAAPIMAGTDLLGAIAVLHPQPVVFTADHLNLLQAICQQVGLAISNARRYQDVDRLVSLLAAEQYRLEGLIEMLPVGVLLLDDKHNLLVTNSLAREFLRDLAPGEDDLTISQLGEYPVSDLLEQHSAPLLPIEIVLDEPSHKIFEVEVQSIHTETPQWVVTLRDVTQEREIQERVQMQERLATVGQLAAGIAHDFNNIMAAIVVYADLLLMDQTLSSSSQERLTIIQQQVQRAASLIRQILDFSRRSVMEQNTLDLLPFLKETKKLLDRTLPETITVDLLFQEEEYVLSADPTRLQQVFMNLAVNARDAMPEGGTLRFELSHLHLSPGDAAPSPDMPPGNWVSIRVSDTGMGIPIEDQSHIFEPFFTTKPVGQGTGLGLAQVYGIIKQHAGYIDMESQIGEGAQFNIYLPTLSEPKEDVKIASPPTEVDGAGKTVLLVEDDYATRKALNAMLTMHNYRVLVAENGIDALAHLESSAEDIVLMVSDIVMPKMGGFDLYEEMQGRWPQIEVLFITGHPLDDQNQQILQQGKVHWLQKPFTIQEFNQFLIELMS